LQGSENGRVVTIALRQVDTNIITMAEWKHGLFGCFDDCKTCIFAYIVPCYVFGKHAEKVGESCIVCALALYFPILNFYAVTKVRGLIREKKGIEGSCFNDLLVWWCCGICALIQEAQEVD
jgi:Cys-rich protein (TIGR01571 family)